MKNRILLTLASIFMILSVYAQEYKGGIIYDLHGPVKEVKRPSEDPMGHVRGKIKFAQNGMEKINAMTFDEEGYPFGQMMFNKGKGSSFRVWYDADRNPVKMVFDNNADGEQIKITTLSEFSNNKMTSKTLKVESIDKSKTLRFDYSDEKYDSHGNWIERHVKQTTLGTTDPNVTEYTETRTISYY